MVAVPVATWTPWVTRYAQIGLAGSGSQDHGAYWYALTRPVTKQTRKQTPTTLPSRAVTTVERSGLLNLGHQCGLGRAVTWTMVNLSGLRASRARGGFDVARSSSPPVVGVGRRRGLQGPNDQPFALSVFRTSPTRASVSAMMVMILKTTGVCLATGLVGALALHFLGSRALLWYTAPGGTVAVSAHRAADGRIAVSVTDACSAIPDPDLDRVCDVGRRAAPERGTVDAGAGLGTAPTKGVTEADRGSVAAGNVPGGSRFGLLPAIPAEG